MRRRLRIIAARGLPTALAILLAAPPLPQAQQPPAPQQAAPAPAQQPAPAAQPGDDDVQPFKPEELEAIVAPIALYPDPLVAQVLMASTYPLEVIQAARLMKSKPNLKDEALNEELKKYNWDDSVKSLCSFPQTLEILNEKIDWMQKLGDAFLDQRKETMDAIQRLRAKAQAQGNLQSNEQQKVIVEAVSAQPVPPPPPGQPPPPPPADQTVIKIEPANPQVIYVPQYNPTVVYGPPPPAYPPYYYPYPPGYAWGAAAISFGVGMAVGAAVWGGCNWGGGDVDIDVNKNNNFTNNVNRGDRATQIKNERGSGQGGRESFKHNPEHRGGAQYRDKGTQQKYNRASSSQAGTRDAYRGRDQGRGGPTAGTREAGAGQRGPTAGTREAGAGSAGGAQQRGGGREAGAFEGMGQGGQERANSQRGQSSVSSSRASGHSSASRGGGSSYSGGGGSRGGAGGGASRGGGGGGSRGGGRR
jgi:hypothetical protein